MARGERAVAVHAVLLDLVGHDHEAAHAFGRHLARDHRHRQMAVHRLAAGHRDRVVVQDLVGDVDLGRDRRADRQVTGVEVGAVAQVLEHVRHLRERGLADPGRAFAAHVGGQLVHQIGRAHV